MDLAEEIKKRKERAKKFGLPAPVFAVEVRAAPFVFDLGAVSVGPAPSASALYLCEFYKPPPL